MRAIRRLPLILLLLGAVSLLALVPAVLAAVQEDFHDARAFFYAGLMGLMLTAFLGLAVANRRGAGNATRQLVWLAAGFVLLPVLLAVPFHQALRTTVFLSAYFEMVSCFTTTGATLYEPGRLSDAEHLWRALVGWFGGFVMWVAASAILAPLTLGGFEVTATGEPGQAMGDGLGMQTDPEARLWRAVGVLTPVYGGLTLALSVMLLVLGEAPLVAFSHAMGVMATSGISPVGGLEAGQAGFAGEAVVLLFLVFGLSRMTFSGDTAQARGAGLRADPEFRLGLVIVAIVPMVLFTRHWIAAFDVGDELNLIAGFQALWGALFTALSFLVTAGYVSAEWSTAQDWSGLSTPGIILLGLALVGGGVATTAGGVKLLRVYALYLNGAREIERLVHPHSVGRKNLVSRRIRREGGFIAWVFFMLFALILAATSVLLGLLGQDFETALVLAIAALTNAGPLAEHAGGAPIDLLALPIPAKLVLCAGMVLGRLELLALIVMLSPDLWRE